jgi:hypothetical protein
MNKDQADRSVTKEWVHGAFLVNGLEVADESIERTTSDISGLLKDLEPIWEIDLGSMSPALAYRLSRWNE